MKAARRAALLALAAIPLMPRLASAAPKKRLAILSTLVESDTRQEYEAVLKALAARGYAEGKQMDVLLSFHVRMNGLDDRVREVVAWKPDVILTQGTAATERLLRLGTKTIPIVTTVSDPVGAGFAVSLARPGGNVTGLSQGAPEVATKTMEVLKVLIPRARRVAVVTVDEQPGRLLAAFPERAAKLAGLEVELVTARRGNEDLPALFRSIASRGFHAAYWSFVPLADETVVAREAIRAAVALVSGSEELAELGALASLNAADQNFAGRAADIVAKIFGGASPAEIPIEYPQRFRFVLNARTAKMLGIKLGPDMLLRADRVIE